MTVEQYGSGSEVAITDESMYGLGLEDVDASDMIIPRLRIVHDKGMITDNLSGDEYPNLKVILLGLVKQRIMWDGDVDEGDKPMCKSPDFDSGFPSVDEEIKKDKRFPWDDSNFNPADFPASAGINGLVTLPCKACVFKEWGQDKKPPRCAEQHTYPLLYSPSGEMDDFTPALFTVQKTGIKPSRNYLSSFVQSRKPMFTALTELSFTQHSRGSVKYSIPVFKRIGNTEAEMWDEYANSFRTMRDFVKAAPRPKDDDAAEGEATSNVNTPSTAPAPTPTPAPQAAPAPAPAPAAVPAAAPPVSSADDDDLPF